MVKTKAKLTGAERAKRYREKRKLDKKHDDEYKKKERERNSKKLKRNEMPRKMLKAIRAKDRERKRANKALVRHEEPASIVLPHASNMELDEEPFTISQISVSELNSVRQRKERFDQNVYKNYVPNYKRTTDKQYNLLKRSMNISAQKNNWHKYKSSNGIIRYKQDNNYWTALTEKLNNIGPPYRTLQQWKKVWSDFSRCERKRRSKNQSKKVVSNKIESNFDNEIYQKESNDDSQNDSSINSNQHIKSETKDYEENSQSVYTTYPNEYENDYSYPDDGAWQQSYVNEKEILIPDESSCASYSSDQRNLNEVTTAKTAEMPDFNKPPPLQPSNAPKLQDQTLYMLQEQMGFQTKLLEHLSQMASSMASIMEQHAEAVEMQTKAIHRQALATERHTAVMNTFVDMVREKMFKGNSQKRTADAENSTNEIL